MEADRPVKGRDLQRGIIDLARTLGWLVAHTPPIKTERGWRTAVAADGKGFPDLLMLRDRIIVAEIKGDEDRLRPEQERWLTAFRMAGVAAFLWTPADWEGGEIDRVLRARSQAAYPVHPMRTLARDLEGPQEAVQRDDEALEEA